MPFILIGLVYLFLCFGVAKLAAQSGRNFVLWFVIAYCITPVFAGVIVLAKGYRLGSESSRWSPSTMSFLNFLARFFVIGLAIFLLVLMVRVVNS
jgi:hypothetical protein